MENLKKFGGKIGKFKKFQVKIGGKIVVLEKYGGKIGKFEKYNVKIGGKFEKYIGKIGGKIGKFEQSGGKKLENLKTMVSKLEKIDLDCNKVKP